MIAPCKGSWQSLSCNCVFQQCNIVDSTFNVERPMCVVLCLSKVLAHSFSGLATPTNRYLVCQSNIHQHFQWKWHY